MYLFIIAGAPGMGKSPFVRKYIEGRNCLVFDVANEYGTKTKYAGQTPVNLSNNMNDARARYTGDDMSVFVNKCKMKRKTICVFEEATGFFRGSIENDTMKLIVGRKHTENVYLFIFHSINRIPPGIMEMAEYMVLFKTNDEWNTVRVKYPRLLPLFEDLQSKANGESHIIKMI